MKKIFLMVFITVAFTYTSIAQTSVSIEGGSGYTLYKPDLANYAQASSIPWYGRLVVHLGLLEVGGEFSGDASPLTYIFEDPSTNDERFQEKHKQSYYGGFIGVNSGKGDKTGVFLRAGAGMNSVTRNIVLNNGTAYSNDKLKSSLEAKGSAGVCVKLMNHLFLNVEGMYGMILNRKVADYATDPRVKTSENFTVTAYGGLIGISVHF